MTAPAAVKIHPTRQNPRDACAFGSIMIGATPPVMPGTSRVNIRPRSQGALVGMGMSLVECNERLAGLDGSNSPPYEGGVATAKREPDRAKPQQYRRGGRSHRNMMC